MKNRVAAMGDIIRLAHCQPRVSSSSAASNSLNFGIGNGNAQVSSRCLCTNALTVVNALTVSNALMVVNPPAMTGAGLGSTFLAPRLPHSKRRVGLKKDPASDKYYAIRAARKEAIAAYVPAHPVPPKARSDPDDGGSATLICPGCGVYMQDMDPMQPGYFRVPLRLEHKPDKEDGLTLEELKKLEETFEGEIEIEPAKEAAEVDKSFSYFEIVGGKMTQLENHDFTPPSDYHKNDVKSLEETWDDIIEGSEEAEERKKRKNLLKSFKRDKPADEERVIVCARCHSLKYYGRVKEATAEHLLPGFDFDSMVGQRLKTAYGKRAVVLMVVDASDFDGSFPRQVAKLISEVEQQMAASYKGGTTGNSPRLIVAATKVDLLPGQLSPMRLEQWIRRRVIIGGAPRPTAVHLVSATKNWGVQALTERITKVAGPRGDVWVVGAQNAGKSSLINALARFNVGKHQSRLTEASHPGTTIGILKITGILPQNIKLYDTPGILHSHQLTLRLNEEEFKRVQIRKELKPRTYRIKVGHTIHVGGYLRLDLLEAPARTIYMTVWASPFISLHMGKTEKAVDVFKKHIGVELQPPGSLKSWLQQGKFSSQTIRVRGDDWEASTVDIAVAGLGWVGLGLKGEAVIDVWTFEGVAVSTREAMVYDYARIFETPGFTVIHQTDDKPKKKPSNAETSFNRKSDRLAKERSAKERSGYKPKPKALLEESKIKNEVEGEPLELW